MGSEPVATVREGELPGMPAPCELRLETVGETVVVSYGGRALACYERGDRGMRNLAIVSLTRAGVTGVEVARLFGIRPEHVSRLRRQADEDGSRGLLPVMGRPPKLDASDVQRAYEMSDAGVTGREIARKLGVSEAKVSRLLKARKRAGEPERLELAVSDTAEIEPEVSDTGELSGARIVEGGGRSVYAGAMLLYPFLDRVGAGGVLGALESGPARRYDTAAVALAATFALALGSSSLEGSKHLQLQDAGLLVGTWRFPHLRTLRPRLGMLADRVDPVEVQVALAKAMLDTDREPPSVFFVDEHFVAYTGSRPVAKGWNTRRRHAEPGRHDTVIVDDRWRAVCFASGPPQGLATGMRAPLDQLQAICGSGRRLMIGFDRGGAYPKVFGELRDRGLDWVTYRRAPLAEPTVKPRASWVEIDGRRHYLRVADERVTLEGYGECRQLTVYEHGRVVLQILTSDLRTPARLAHTLRCRWCIENTFKYLEDHHGLHWLCDYQIEITPDTTPIRNPERTTALAQLRAHEQTVIELEQQIGQHHTTTPDTDSNPAETLCMLQADLYTARAEVRAAKAALKPIPAKLPANTIDPDAQCATPRVNRRALQTVCRLLAYNAELDLARALNTYLTDPDEHRTITRHLLHQPGHIHYTPTSITVTIDQPHAPRIARALGLLIDQINNDPPKLAGENRRITYQTARKP